MEIKIYHPQFLEAIQSIQLSEEDARYTKTPLENLESAKANENRHPTFVMEGGKCVAFFTLHEGDGPAPYSTNPKAIFFRSFTVDARYRGKGVGKRVIHQLSTYIKDTYPHINEILLTVNIDNPRAIHLYEQAGYLHIGKSTMIGKPVYVMSYPI